MSAIKNIGDCAKYAREKEGFVILDAYKLTVRKYMVMIQTSVHLTPLVSCGTQFK